MTWRGIPVTTPARTLVDLAAVVSAEELARAVHQADVLHSTTPDDVEAVIKRRPRSKGIADLREVLHGDGGRTLSKLERAFIKRLKANNLPLPKTNRPAGGRFVDCRWPKHKLTVELDQFRRYTWGDVVEHPGPALSELRAVLVPV